jgi:hypothetical protein
VKISSSLGGFWLRLLNIAAFALLAAAIGQTQTNLDNKSASETSGMGKVALYAAVGPELTQYDLDVDAATLTKRGSLTLPANVQEATPHPSKQYLYIAWSNGGPSNFPQGAVAPNGSQHGISHRFRFRGLASPWPARSAALTPDSRDHGHSRHTCARRI